MILSFHEEVAKIEDVFGTTLTSEKGLELSMILVGLLDRGMSTERRRIIGMLQQNRNVMNVRQVVDDINKPLR